VSASPIEAPLPLVSGEPKSRHGSQAVAHSILSKMVILGLQAATGILTARALQPAGRGELAAMILWPLFVASVTTLGLPSSLIYYLRHRPEERERLIANGLLMAAVLGIAAAALTAFILPWWLRQYPLPIIHAAEWFLITVPICSITLAGRAILEASHEFSMSNVIQTLTPFATLIGLLAYLAAHRLNPYTAATAYIAASIPTFWLMFSRLRRAGLKGPGLKRAGLKQWSCDLSAMKLMLGYGVRSYGVDLLGTLALQVDQVLVISLLSPFAMGSYVVVLSLSRMLNLFQNSVVMVLFPKAAGRSVEDVVRLTGRSVRVSGLVTTFFAVFVCAAGPTLLRVLYGKEYVSAIGALKILVIEVVLSGATFVLAQAFMALGRPGVVTLLQAFGLSLSIPMMLWLIPRYGIYGAAVSLLTSTVARLIFIYSGFRIFLKVRPPRLLPTVDDGKLLWQTAVHIVPERVA
jgi:O-antigen/teichoic acid export membrane protein